MIKKKILIISYSYIEIDTRVNRQISTLKDDYEITLMSYGESTYNDITHIKLPRKNNKNKLIVLILLLLQRYEKSYWASTENNYIKKVLGKNNFDLVICNEIDTVPVVVKFLNNIPIYLDLHEYAPLELENSLVWRLIFKKYKYYLCKTYLAYPKVISTVSRIIAEKYESEFQVKKLHVVKSTPHYENLTPREVSPLIKVIFHGAASPERKLTRLIKILRKLDSRFSIDFYLYKQKAWYFYVVKLLSLHSNIKVLDAIPMKLLSKNANFYDLGLIVYNNQNFNVSGAMPNKLFEYIQGRVGLIVGTSLSLQEFVKYHGNGIYSEEETLKDLTEKINRLSIEDISAFKKKSNELAPQFCWEKEESELLMCIEILQRG